MLLVIIDQPIWIKEKKEERINEKEQVPTRLHAMEFITKNTRANQRQV